MHRSTLDSAIAAIDAPPTAERLVQSGEIRMSEIIAALSVALDITQGNVLGYHAQR